MGKKTLDVSIVTSNYNNGPYLMEFVQSIVDSEALPAELIIIDDGSTDNSLEILEGLKNHEWVKIIKSPKNQGFANALNIGIDCASSTYLLRVDPDDRIHPRRIDLQFDFLNKNIKYDMLGSNAIYFNSINGEFISETNFPLSELEINKRILRGEHGMLHGTVMGKSNIFKAHKYRQAYVPAEDYDIFARMLKGGAKFHNLKEALTEVRIHFSSVSNNIKKDTIKKTYDVRDEVFGFSTSRLTVSRYYHHIKFYRKYLFDPNPLRRRVYLAISAILYPEKVVRRIIR